MKVTVEGTAEELLDLADILARGVRDVHTGIAGLFGGPNVSSEDTNIPNRFREEGVQ